MSSEAPAPGAWSGRAPGRVNLIGEHVDYMGGLVLPAAIDRFTTVRGRPAPDWEVSSEVEGGLAYVRAAGELLGARPSRVEVESTVPAGSGVSSSAALLVAVAAGLRPDLGGREAALVCRRAEEAATGVKVGIMDQFASALGRRGHALLIDCSSLDFRLVPFPAGLVIAVIDSGIRRSLAATPYNRRRAEAEAGDARRMRHVTSEVARVRAFADALEAGRVTELGPLLKDSHRSLRDDFEVSTPEVDALVERAWTAPGCLGARLMGAGFGGSVLALVESGSEERFRARLEGAPLMFCGTADGPFAAAAG